MTDNPRGFVGERFFVFQDGGRASGSGEGLGLRATIAWRPAASHAGMGAGSSGGMTGMGFELGLAGAACELRVYVGHAIWNCQDVDIAENSRHATESNPT